MEDYTSEMIKDMAFSFCPQCGTAIVPNHKGRPRNRIIACHGVRKELEYVGINQASLFPEVDKVADYLRRMA